ncbi:mannitol dehydrogenase family protein [Roseibium sp.]|uniref:mannitol dehydrogenase family protein n=1 Tax=Roseibium sp. TaxID=1936156 RepID=UPI003A975D99
MAIELNQNALADLSSGVNAPNYDRSKLTAGIVHIGVGNFHRAHQAVYLDRLFAKGRDHDWAIVGAGVKSFDNAMRERLKDQDWLTTIVELDPNGFNATVIGSMIDFAEINPNVLIAQLIKPEIRIVSLTITEGGYYVDAKTGGFDATNPDVIADAANPGSPRTVFGILITALALRKDNGIQPFTILSCDNLPENGKITRQAMLGLAELMAPDLTSWIASNVAFPNSMVDCITPATSDRERDMVANEFGIIDQAPVACEPFRQWVMEDHFPAGRPYLEEVGVEFVNDVAPYELMKLRILNGGHAAIAYPSALLGHHFVHDAMADPDISAWLKKLISDEVVPLVPTIPGIDFNAYLAKCAERFSNPAVGDTIPRLCLDGSNRQPKFILPSIEDALKSGRPLNGLALEVVLWCRYCAETADLSNGIALEDERRELLQKAAIEAKDRPAAFLELEDVFGRLGRNATFADAFSEHLNYIWRDGVRAALARYLEKVDA